MNKIEKQLDKWPMISLNLDTAYTRVMDSSLASESMAMHKSDLKLDFCISTITDAQSLSTTYRDSGSTKNYK